MLMFFVPKDARSEMSYKKEDFLRLASGTVLAIGMGYGVWKMFSKGSSIKKTKSRVCAYLTDVEGNFNYFERFVKISKVLCWADSSESKLELADGAEFVFGGDSQDKGTGDIRFVRLLVDLKQRYPDRVHLIIGNRDANKLRIAAELNPQTLQDKSVLNDPSFPYWVAEATRVTPAMYLAKQTGAEAEDNLVNRLKWMLKDTMGAEGALERRRLELEILSKRKVTEQEAAESYLKEVDVTAAPKDRFMLEYLRLGQLGYIFAGRTLFVHGGVSPANMGTVPGQKSIEHDPHTWIKKLNQWCKGEMGAYVNEPLPHKGSNTKDRAGHGLMDYGVPGGNGGQTVVYSGKHLSKGNPVPIDPTAEQYLARGGIRTLAVGHTPHGDAPVVVRGKSLTLVAADTSYSHFGHKEVWGTDNRGQAVSECLFYPEGRVEIHGIAADGSPMQCTAASPAGARREASEDSLIGRCTKDGFWVKNKLVRREKNGEAIYHMCKGEGRKITNKNLTESECRRQTRLGL